MTTLTNPNSFQKSLDHSASEMRSLDCEGLSVRYTDRGVGTPVLFLHNGGASHAIWNAVQDGLGTGYRMIAIDFPGFGQSDKPRHCSQSKGPFRYDLPMLATTIDQVVRSLELHRPILVGNCMGSAAALTYALHSPGNVAGLLLCNVLTLSTITAGELGRLHRLSERIPGIHWLLSRSFEAGSMPARFRKWSIDMQLAPGKPLPAEMDRTFDYLFRQPSQLRVFNNMTVHLSTFAKLDRIEKPRAFPPLWVIWGKHNRVLPSEQGLQFCHRFGVDRCEVLHDSGHLPMIDRPETIVQFINELSTASQEAGDSKSTPSISQYNQNERIHQLAVNKPNDTAIIEASSSRRVEKHTTWSDLAAMANQIAWELRDAGLCESDRILLLVPPSPNFLALSQAIAMLGASAVFIDGGLSLRAMEECIRQAKPTAFVGIPKAHLLRLLVPRAFEGTRLYFSFASNPAPFSRNLLRRPARNFDVPFPISELSPDSIAAIIFTSGSTGAPKGVEVSYRNLHAMMARSAQMIDESCGGTAIILYPLFLQIFALMGKTSILPDIDFSRPASVDPKHVLDCIDTHGASLGFSSPAILVRLAAYCRTHGRTLDSMKLLLAAGAPISIRPVIEPFVSLMPHGRVITPYGATEALPIATIDSDEIVRETAERAKDGAGTCVGRPIPGVRIRIISITDDNIDSMENVIDLPEGQVGEICVAGDNVTRRYLNRPELIDQAKIVDPTTPSGFWHRMGDVGYIDAQQRLWFCGRKKHRVVTSDRIYFAQQPEGVADAIPGVRRSAFVGVYDEGYQIPILVIEPEAEKTIDWIDLATTIQQRLIACGFAVKREHILLHQKPFPVDPRHNAKIHRESLARWAANRLGRDQNQKSSFKRSSKIDISG